MKKEIKILQKCYDCGKEMRTKDNEILNGKVLAYQPPNGEKVYVFKCNECYKKDKSLKDYQKCEVYTRVVGYLRPVKQFNSGKQQEFKERKNFKPLT